MITIIAGALDPESLLVDVVRPDGETLDLTGVTSVVLDVRTPSGRFMWDTAIELQTDALITCRHTFSAGETDTAGEYVVRALLALTGGGQRRAGFTAFRVIDV